MHQCIKVRHSQSSSHPIYRLHPGMLDAQGNAHDIRGRFAEKTGSAPDVALAADWRNQPVIVNGRRMSLGQVKGGKLYHGSTRELPVGTMLEPQEQRNFTQSADDAVSITSDYGTARYWATESAKGTEGTPVYVYEVEPIGHVDDWRTGPANYGTEMTLFEGRCPAARITAVSDGSSTTP